MPSYGDWVALSDTCDVQTAILLKREVSDGIIAPDYTPEALEVLKSKKKGNYNVVKIDPNYVPAPISIRMFSALHLNRAEMNSKLTKKCSFRTL